MLNYIWLALIFLGISAAVTLDLRDNINDKYKNGKELNVRVEFLETGQVSGEASLFIKGSKFADFYSVKDSKDFTIKAKLSQKSDSKEYSFFVSGTDKLPTTWKEMARANGKEDDLSGTLKLIGRIDSTTFNAALVLEKISFIKMKEVTNAAIDYASTAVNIAIGLIGIMALWLGIMKIGESAGLIAKIAKSIKPVTKFLFPDVPQDHPAVGSIIMNISANMLGLGNAATPFGLKAMEELDSLNENKGTATNAMCTFLTINTAGLTLIPATAIAIRAASGSSDPAIIIGTSFFGALCATITGITAAKILEKFSINNFNFLQWMKSNTKFILAILVFLSVIIAAITLKLFTIINVDVIRSIIQVFSSAAIPLIIISFVIYGAVKKVKIYETFVDGAKEGFNIAIRIIPFLVAMLVAIGIFRTGGAMDYLIWALSPLTGLIGFPAEALPMALMRPLSGSGALGIMSETLNAYGPDSFIGILTSTIMGSTETTFYVLALYFGSVNIKKTRHAVAAGVLADIAGILAALFIVRIIFG